MLTTKTPSFILANSASERRPRVSGVKGQLTEMISAVARSSSRETYVASRAAWSIDSELNHKYATGSFITNTQARCGVGVDTTKPRNHAPAAGRGLRLW